MHADGDHRGVVLVDPHRDLAVSALRLVPRTRQANVVYLDVSTRRRPFGINLLDVGLGWDRDQATANALRIFRREFEGYWEPRIEDAFRFARSVANMWSALAIPYASAAGRWSGSAKDSAFSMSTRSGRRATSSTGSSES
jgi:hypothetical protein